MVNFVKTSLLLLLYPVLYLRFPITIKWFAASLAGLAAFVILLTTLQDVSATDSHHTQTGAPLIAYFGGYAMAGGMVLLNRWIEQIFPRPVPVKVAPRAGLLELEPLARAAAEQSLEIATSSLSEGEKSAIVFGANLGEDWAVFDWYIPAMKPSDARVIVRSAVDRETKNVVVENNPAQAKHPYSARYLALRSGIASLAVAAVFTLIAAMRDYMRFHQWPTLYHLWQTLLFSWLVCLAYFFVVLIRFRSTVPIRLPSGKLLFVERATT